MSDAQNYELDFTGRLPVSAQEGMGRLKMCPKCQIREIRGPRQPYCKPCTAEWRRNSLKKHPDEYGKFSLQRRLKVIVRSTMNNAIRRGTLIKGDNCEICGATNPEAHHDDYAKPLEVRWLCKDCHCKLHREIGAIPVKERPIRSFTRKRV